MKSALTAMLLLSLAQAREPCNQYYNAQQRGHLCKDGYKLPVDLTKPQCPTPRSTSWLGNVGWYEDNSNMANKMGDVCRNADRNGAVNWDCPIGCEFAMGKGFPYCVMGDKKEACRLNNKNPNWTPPPVVQPPAPEPTPVTPPVDEHITPTPPVVPPPTDAPIPVIPPISIPPMLPEAPAFEFNMTRGDMNYVATLSLTLL